MESAHSVAMILFSGLWYFSSVCTRLVLRMCYDCTGGEEAAREEEYKRGWEMGRERKGEEERGRSREAEERRERITIYLYPTPSTLSLSYFRTRNYRDTRKDKDGLATVAVAKDDISIEAIANHANPVRLQVVLGAEVVDHKRRRLADNDRLLPCAPLHGRNVWTPMFSKNVQK
jgi:hypothetical protein